MQRNNGLVWFLTLSLLIGLIYLVGFSPSALSSPGDLLISQTINPQIDTFVASGQPSSSFANEQGLWVGNRNFNSWGDQRTLLQFVVPANITTTATITTATLSLYMAGWPPADSPLIVQAYLVKRDWNATITWNEIGDMIDNSVAPVEIVIPAAEGLYQWNVAALLKSWLSNSSHSPNFGILLRAQVETANRFRGFWGSECPLNLCNGRQPKLIIEYALAVPTLTPIPTVTPIPTSTSTPTPGIQSIYLSNEPQGELAGGAEVRYSIEVQNGTFPLTNVIVSNIVPAQMELLPTSIEAPPDWTVRVTDRWVQWVRASLPVSATVSLAYRAQRHTPTITPTPTNTFVVTEPATATMTPSPTDVKTTEPATPTPTATATVSAATPTPTGAPTATATATLPPAASGLTITKSGPAVVPVGSDIAYTLRVTNHLTRSLTGLTIVDLVPLGVEVVDFGGGSTTMPPSQMIQWQVPLINPGGAVSRGFAVRPLSNANPIRNELYFVDVIENGRLVMRAVGAGPVVTTIGMLSLADHAASLSVTAPLTTNPPILNEGAVVSWEYPAFNNQMSSNKVRNPFQLYLPVLYLPVIGR